jgi:phosphopentomutase
MKRVFLLVLDSLGIGSTQDSYKFDDKGSNTLGHIAEYCYNKQFQRSDKKLLHIPFLTSLGIGKALEKSCGFFPLGLQKNINLIGSYAYCSEISTGKDTCSGHWEIAGSPVLKDWHYFKNIKNSFSERLLKKISNKTGINNFLGNMHSSGTEIIDLYGIEHIKTNFPIIYTSIDSVFQVACHEDYFGLNNLYNLCKNIRIVLDENNYNVCRVIARPFIGEKKSFVRTRNRKDFSKKPSYKTMMEHFLENTDGEVISIGKIFDIFSGIGISKSILRYSLDDIFLILENESNKKFQKNKIFFVNFVDFDSLWGHRRDVLGYSKELEKFDKKLFEFFKKNISDEDLLIITADHGCDPTWKGNDHTRENVPVLLYNKFLKPKYLGHRKTFADIAQTILKYFNLSKINFGKSMI